MENKKQWIDFLLKKSKFKLTEEEISKFEQDLDVFIEQLKSLDNIDLTNVRSTTTPFNKNENILREDDDIVVNKPEIVLENASKTKDGYIFLEKEEK